MKLADLKLLSDHEQRRLLEESRGPELPFPADATIAQVFRKRVAESPSVRAVAFNGSSLTYRELEDWSDRLAGELVAAHGTGPGQLVALFLDRGIEMTVAILAVWKAGAAYVPIDPETPDERVRYMLDDTAAPVVLCSDVHQSRMERISAADTAVRAVDGQWGRDVRRGAAAAPTERGAHAGSLAYVIYTSGTSGRPKGVMIENRSVVNHVCVISDLYGFAGEPGQEVMLQGLNYAFDGGVVPMVLALLTGNSLLHVPERLLLRGEELTRYLRDNGVTHMNGTPTLYKHMGLGEVPSLRRMVVGGEALDTACFREMTRVNKVAVFNEYGPTEATISTTSHAAREYDLAIGRPQSNSSVLILDEALRPVPVGAVGEVFLGGPGLARGYLNMPEATREKFIPNPFQSDEEKTDVGHGPDGRNARLYRTGDLARRRSDGALEYVGRNDSQIKVRGFRVELAEIEATLNEHPEVEQSAVLPLETGRQQGSAAEVSSLVGFYVAAGPLDADELLRRLESALPSYMVPSELVHLDALPMTVNGKLDTKALHAWRSGAHTDGIAPRTEVEARVQEIIADIIDLEPARVGIEDDLFALGLNSILVIRLISALNNDLGVDITVPLLFMAPTIAELTASPEFQNAQVGINRETEG